MALLRLTVAAACLVGSVFAQHLPLPELPYAYDALEPYIDVETMRVHHLKHHQAYTDNTNAVLGRLRESPEYKPLAKMGIDVLLTKLDKLPEEDRAILRNHGGGYVNHDLFWKIMSPHGGAQSLDAEGPLVGSLQTYFGSVEAFVAEFTKKALGLFGSGWVWLYVDATGETPTLLITTTANQDTPAMTEGHIPILCLDVWEHAYYLKYQNNRAEYIKNWWHVVNWPMVEKLYVEALEKLKERAHTEL